MMIRTADSSETLIAIYQTTQRHISQDRNLIIRRPEKQILCRFVQSDCKENGSTASGCIS